MNIKLIPLQEHEKEIFIRNIQIAFKKAVVEQFGPFDEEIIPRDHVIRSFEAEGAESYNIVLDGESWQKPQSLSMRANLYLMSSSDSARKRVSTWNPPGRPSTTVPISKAFTTSTSLTAAVCPAGCIG